MVFSLNQSVVVYHSVTHKYYLTNGDPDASPSEDRTLRKNYANTMNMVDRINRFASRFTNVEPVNYVEVKKNWSIGFKPSNAPMLVDLLNTPGWDNLVAESPVVFCGSQEVEKLIEDSGRQVTYMSELASPEAFRLWYNTPRSTLLKTYDLSDLEDLLKLPGHSPKFYRDRNLFN